MSDLERNLVQAGGLLSREEKAALRQESFDNLTTRVRGKIAASEEIEAYKRIIATGERLVLQAT